MHDELAAILEEAIAEPAFPGAVLWLAHDESVIVHEACGTTAYEDAISRPVRCDTCYDIASLSKLFTATAFLIAMRATSTDVNTPLAQFLPEFDTDDKRAITLRQLLNHTNGLGLHIQTLTDVPHDEWIARIAAAPLRSAPGDEVYYTCTSYFLLARVIESLVAQPLDRFIDAQLLQPLGMQATFRPLDRWKPDEITSHIAPTEIDEASGQPWHGVVHDEAARAWSTATESACGNAGLFATAQDLALLARLWLDDGAFEGRQILHPIDVRKALTDTVTEDNIRRGWCWQIDAPSFMSEMAPPGSAGHTGFTGPTLWLNPTTRHVAIILENRVCPTRHGPNRMPYHRRIAEWLLQTRNMEDGTRKG
ncbi:MAG: beta-lactamase family protein [Armatimonadota bacterium]|nr:beta-lactamase family protein [Armatimonadota bacterium]